jgi:hypothetical protein
MMLLEEYSTAMDRALTTAYGGQASIGDSAHIMAMVGIKGSGTVQHHNLHMETHTLVSNTFFEVGVRTTVKRMARNDTSQTMQTKSRLYLVSEHLLPGAPLSMMDTRLVAPITEDCALVVHSTLGHYKCVQGGNITCYKHGDRKRIYTLRKGDSLFLDPRDTCTSTCTQIGHSTGYHKMYKNLPTQPTVHPPSMRVYYADMEEYTSPLRVFETSHQVSHDILQGNIRGVLLHKDLLMNNLTLNIQGGEGE